MKHRRVIRRVFVTGLLVTGMLSASSAVVADDRPPDVVKSFIAAVNAGNLSQVDALLAPDSEFTMPQRWSGCSSGMSARQCQMAWIKHGFGGSGTRLEVSDVRNTREIVRVNVVVTSDPIRKAGADRILVTHEYIVTNGRISSIIQVLRTEDPQTAAYKKG